MFCSNGSREASRSNSAFSRSRCLFDGLLFVTPSFGCGFRLKVKNRNWVVRYLILLYFYPENLNGNKKSISSCSVEDVKNNYYL